MIRPKLAEFKLMFLMMAVFTTVAIGFWQAFDQPFYLINFAIIGLSISLGMGLWPLLPRDKKPWARRLSQVLVGGYLFFGLGCGLIYLSFGVIVPENMEIEGFWFMVFAGVFQAAAIHYFVAKIVGPIFFNRGWCGWACWTAAVLDLLPWKMSPGRVPGRWGHLRYLHFALALGLVASLVFIFGYTVESQHGIVIYKEAIQTDTPQYTSMFMIPEMWWFLIGNLLYFGSGIVLAVVLKDNRAFCKYVCPIVGFLKPSECFDDTNRTEERQVHPLYQVYGQLPDGHRRHALRAGGQASLVDRVRALSDVHERVSRRGAGHEDGPEPLLLRLPSRNKASLEKVCPTGAST